MLAWSFGCGFDSSGGSGSGNLGPEAEGDSTSESSASPSPEATSEADPTDASGTSASTTSASTTSDSTTNDSTSDPTTPDPTTHDPTTNDSTTNDDTTTTTTAAEDESTGPGFEWYTDCDCEPEIEQCVPFSYQGNVFANVCYAAPSPPCTDDPAVCPLPPSGTATPACWMGLCGLDCSAGTCPDGMSCYNLGGGVIRCAWPV
jgi:hypothetical protein